MSAVARLDHGAADRLVKVCRLFSSNMLGERAAAAGMANKIVADLGLDWSDIIRPASKSSSERTYAGTWRDNLVLALKHPFDLTPWERGFVDSMRTRLDATAKQRISLAEIAARLRARGCR